MYRGPALTLLAAGAIAAGCSSGHAQPSANHPCTLIGAISGVSFDFGSIHLARTDRVTLCVNGHCQTTEPGKVEGTRSSVGDGSLGPGQVAVSMTVRSAAGHLKHVARGNVRTARAQPNGPGCEPTVWQATVRAQGERLVPVT